jgi:plastocyanin
MTRPNHRSVAALPAVAGAATAALLVAGCSSSSTAPSTPTVDQLGSQASVTPGMPGGGTASASVAPSGTGSPTEAPAPTGPNAAGISNFAFAPATLTVPVGTQLTWTNKDEERHTVAAGDGSFHSPGLGTNATYSDSVSTAGTHDYSCSLHPGKHGAVVVTP